MKLTTQKSNPVKPEILSDNSIFGVSVFSVGNLKYSFVLKVSIIKI